MCIRDREEDVLTYAMFPQVAPKFFAKRNAKKQGVDGDHVDYTNQSHPCLLYTSRCV